MIFKQNFSYEYDIPTMDETLKVIKQFFFEEIPAALSSFPQWTMTIQTMMECYNLTGDKYYDDPRHVHIRESEGI